MAPQFDHVRAFVKLLAHRLSPLIRPGGQPRCPHHPNHFVGSIFRGVPPFRRDERPGGKHARSRYAIFPHPFLQPERHVPLRSHVSHTRDTALQEVPQLFRSAQRRVRFVHPHAKIRFRQRVRQVRMEINQARQNRLSGNIDHLRIFGPVGRSSRKNLHYLVSFDDQRALVCRCTSSIKNSSAAQNDCSLWPSWPRLDHDTPRIIAHLRFRIEKLPPVLPSLLRPAMRARKRNEQHHQRSGLHFELPPRTRFLPHPVIRRLKKKSGGTPFAHRPHCIRLVTRGLRYFGASSFFSASANSLGHKPNTLSISSSCCATSIFAVRATGHGAANRSGRSAIQNAASAMSVAFCVRTSGFCASSVSAAE